MLANKDDLGDTHECQIVAVKRRTPVLTPRDLHLISPNENVVQSLRLPGVLPFEIVIGKICGTKFVLIGSEFKCFKYILLMYLLYDTKFG